ncbi:hypothetical protein GCM10010873_22500 [Cypionkella aquatica]|uniref:Uncharacterized protein n=1 Tax=Cypionkella aquatica TaxID=1756042 RepID=A0AA37X456_9RHOB|nr:hypothetical protein [Cypionkella aquatica]GLS87276.1 hypothetical protein GCM10010873_22500 [Cypionkella aquatica]
MDHAHDHDAVDGPWAGGWLVAVLAALIAVGLARWLGEVDGFAAVIIALVVFGVYAVLLGNGGVELTVTADHDHDGHGNHGHAHSDGHH